ncbi:MAG: class I SAM-dependent methyltransferase [Candidatus Bathyarchaeia archaeon]
MPICKEIYEKIHEANVAIHRLEARYYELLHPEIYNKCEQKRIYFTLKILDKIVADNKKKALDVGAGSGNLTGKLLSMNYNVTAVDISPEMCAILKKKYEKFLETKKLVIINSPIENVSFEKGEFDIITCYSVLHHLPDYVGVIQRLSSFLKKGGVMYLDHEASPFYWKGEKTCLARLGRFIYFYSSLMINSLHLRTLGINIPSLDYSMADYWHNKEHHLDHKKIRDVFQKENFSFLIRIDYHLNRTRIPNPIFNIYRNICKPDMSLWIARK